MEQNKSVNKERLQKILSWVETLVTAVVIAVVLNCFVIVNAVIPTGSMISTINIGDRVIANRLAYLFDEAQRGDIIVFDGHVAIALDGSNMIHAGSTKGCVYESSFKTDYWKNCFYCAYRIF